MVTPVSVVVIDWVLLLVTFVIFGARLLVFFRHRKTFMHYNTEIILCTVLAVGTASVGLNTWKNYRLIRAEHNHEGFKSRDDMLIFQKKFIYVQSFVYYVMVWLVKAAFLSTYFHFRETITRACRHALYVLTALVGISFIFITMMMFMTCRPIERAWLLTGNSCSPQKKIWNHSKTAACNILTDLFLIALFLAILRRLHLGRRERWGVIFFLTVSAVPVLAAALRLVVIISALKHVKTGTSRDADGFRDVLYLASEVEVTTAFIAACLPAMRVFFREKRQTRQYSRTSNEYKGGNKAPPGTPRSGPHPLGMPFLPRSSNSSDIGVGFGWEVHDFELQPQNNPTGLNPPPVRYG